MLNRLLESWLDSTNERSYQAPFCQMLAGQGHIVLHSTRHSALEYGKDVVTKGPDGMVCAYQLKGNPGGRLTLSEFRGVQGQLVQLMTQPIIIPGIRTRTHRSYLVTNGQVDEEVHRAIDDLNRAYAGANAPGAPLELMSRGNLLAWAQQLGSGLWPSELSDINRLLQFLVMSGEEPFPSHLFHQLMAPMLFLEHDKDECPNASELRRHITSTAILTGVCLRNFYLKDNHYACINAWTMLCTYAIAACERHTRSFKRNAGEAVGIALEAIFNSLTGLCDELMRRRDFVQGDALLDGPLYRGRYTLLIALMALYWFWCEEKGWSDEGRRTFIHDFIPREFSKSLLWGEAAIPQMLLHIWYLRVAKAGLTSDVLLRSLLHSIIRTSIEKNSIGLPSPYYSLEDCIQHDLKRGLPERQDPFQYDSFKHQSYFAVALMHLLARTNMKQQCKAIWPDFTHLSSRRFEPRYAWMYCLQESEEGREVLEQPKLTKEWTELVNEARDVAGAGIPQPLRSNRYLLALFLVLFPYRATPSAIRYLARQFDRTWFIPDPIP